MNKDAHSVVMADFKVTVTWPPTGKSMDQIVTRMSSSTEAIHTALIRLRPVADEFSVHVAIVPNSERRVTAKQYLERVQAGDDPFDDKFFDQKGEQHVD